MLRALSPVRPVAIHEVDEALDLCAQDRPASVFVAARIAEGALQYQPGSVLGFRSDGQLRALCWAGANIVPIGADEEAIDAFTARLRRSRRHTASLFGPAEPVERMWNGLAPTWSPARAIRAGQPLLATQMRPSVIGVEPHPEVRLATAGEVGIVLPAAAAMFTGEIGYPPYRGSDHAYRQIIADLIDRGHTFVWVDRGEVLFKADVGSLAIGEAQLQGVWLTPRLRGMGLSVPLIAAVTEQVLATVAESVSLYVNSYNAAARAAYRTVGFVPVGEFATILL